MTSSRRERPVDQEYRGYKRKHDEENDIPYDDGFGGLGDGHDFGRIGDPPLSGLVSLDLKTVYQT